MQIGVAEFLDTVSKLNSDEKIVEALKYNDSVVLRTVLQGAFDPSVEWLLPHGKPPYRVNDLPDQEHVLIKEAKKIQYFVKGFYDNLPQTKREMMFIEFLERLAPKDAELLCYIKEKIFPYTAITVQHVMQAFPDMMPDYEPPKNPQIVEEKKSAPVKNDRPKIICPHCGKEGTSKPMMNRYHFNNCSQRKEEQVITHEQIQA